MDKYEGTFTSEIARPVLGTGTSSVTAGSSDSLIIAYSLSKLAPCYVGLLQSINVYCLAEVEVGLMTEPMSERPLTS